MVLETPPKALGTVDDFWWRWVIDFGAPGPDRGEGGKYLRPAARLQRARCPRAASTSPVPGPTASCGSAARSWRKTIRSRRSRSSRKYQDLPLRARRRRHQRRRVSGRQGHAWHDPPPPATVFHEGSGKVMNTIPPNDSELFELLNEVVQQEPATSLDPELMGPLAAIGIVKGKPFAPDARMKKIMTDALAVANATSRTPLHESARPELVLLSRFGLDELSVHQRLRVRDADPDDHARRRQALPAHRLPHAGCAHGLLLRRHRHHARPWPCDCPASARSISSPCWMRTRSISTAPRPTR